MWDFLSILNRFSDVIAIIMENKDKIKVTNYEVSQYEDVVVITITSENKESADLINKIISTVMDRLYKMQAGGDQVEH